MSTINLSTREKQVLSLISKNKKNKEIASELGIHEKTVHTYKARFSKKIGIPTYAKHKEIVTKAKQLNLIIVK